MKTAQLPLNCRLLDILVVLLAAMLRTSAATFQVTTTADAGPGSLRQAILDANSAAGADEIYFQISGSPPYMIAPMSPLPVITNSSPGIINSVLMDGATQPGFSGRPIIELNGQNAGPAADGLRLVAAGCTIRGLVINRFSQDGISLTTSGITRASGTIIEGNFIGTDVTGTISQGNGRHGIFVTTPGNRIGGTNEASRNVISGNGFSGIILFQRSGSANIIQGNVVGLNEAGTGRLGNGQDGIFLVDSVGNIIGGTTSASRNVISGNGFSGLELASWDFSDPGATNVVAGNFIGTDATGRINLGNAQAGINLSHTTRNLIGGTVPGAANVISGNGIIGIQIWNSSFNNLVRGNLIGTDVSGTQKLGNMQAGINVLSSGNIIGGTTLGAGNLISGNGLSGIILQGAAGNLVQGNFIGTDITGTIALGNREDGVFITAGANNTVGGTTPGARNVISANGLSGLEIWDNATGNLVQGNFIGADLSGTANLGNAEHGVYFQNSSTNTVGGSVAGAANLIAFNKLSGVFVESGANNLIRGNSIFNNTRLGIDLAPSGVSPNDSDDSDSGANNLQNFPFVSVAVANFDGSTTISGAVITRPYAVVTIELFSNAICSPSGYGEGQTLIGATALAAGPTGSNRFTVTFTNTVSIGRFISATATDADANTSEFCPCVRIEPRPQLHIARETNQFVITWPSTTASGFTLQSTTNLSPPVLWAPVTNATIASGPQNTVRLNVFEKIVFYRLVN